MVTAGEHLVTIYLYINISSRTFNTQEYHNNVEFHTPNTAEINNIPVTMSFQEGEVCPYFPQAVTSFSPDIASTVSQVVL